MINPMPWFAPLFFGSLGLMGGCFTFFVVEQLDNIPCVAVWLIGILFILCGLCLVKKVPTVAIMIFFFCCGNIRCYFYKKHISDLEKIVKSYGSCVFFEGVISDRVHQKNPYQHYKIIAQGMLCDPLLAASVPARIAIFTSNKGVDCAVGDTIFLKNGKAKMTFHPSYNVLLYGHNYEISVTCTRGSSLEIKERPRLCVSRSIFAYRERMWQRLMDAMHSSVGILYSLLFLGRKTDNKKEFLTYQSLFKRWGIVHYLARSGLHMVLFSWVLAYSMRVWPLSLSIKTVFMLLISALYYSMSWPSIPFRRAWYMFVLAQATGFMSYHLSVLHALVLVFCALIFENPSVVLCLDFQLSFLITFALVWWSLFCRVRQRLVLG